MKFIFMNAVNSFFQILALLIVGRAILSWFVRSPYGGLYKIYHAVIQVTEPILAPCRKLLARFGLSGTIDFSPILAIIALNIINRIVFDIMRIIMF
jgi:YggT family protein